MRAAGMRRWPGGRNVWIALGVLVGTVLLLWGADLLARRAAEGLVAQALQEQTGTVREPVVTVRGPLFLPQVLRGRYDEVEISMDGVTSGPLRIATVDARLEDVYLSFHDLLRGDADRLLITGTEAEALLSYDDLNRYLELSGRPLTLEAADPDELRVTGSADLLGSTVRASADVDLGADDGALVVEPRRFSGVAGLSGVSELLLGERFTFRVPLDPLPFAQRITGIEATDAGVLVDVAGDWVLIEP
ncbi:LmeA family phospholipid-binding protein [Blastococcus sp. SYSU DS0539]